MQNDSLDEAQPGIKTAARNVSNLRYADDNIHMSLFPLFPCPICHEVMGLDAMILVF